MYLQHVWQYWLYYNAHHCKTDSILLVQISTYTPVHTFPSIKFNMQTQVISHSFLSISWPCTKHLWINQSHNLTTRICTQKIQYNMVLFFSRLFFLNSLNNHVVGVVMMDNIFIHFADFPLTGAMFIYWKVLRYLSLIQKSNWDY